MCESQLNQIYKDLFLWKQEKSENEQKIKEIKDRLVQVESDLKFIFRHI